MYKAVYEGDGGIYAKVVADSEFAGSRITTLELNYPRFIHAEFMTHRMFSRNASSSRAIPVNTMLAMIKGNPAKPIHWGKNQPGMQASEELDKKDGKRIWNTAKKRAVEAAEYMSVAGYHKQIVNRITEPYQFIRVVVTATEWDNFFKLRLHEAAQPEIHELARCMFEAMELSEVKDLDENEWHLPYIEGGYSENADSILISAAKCARVSYKNHDNTDTTDEENLALAKRLWTMEHMSPFEHQAKPMPIDAVSLLPSGTGLVFKDGITHFDRRGQPWSGNFKSWIQYRQWAVHTQEQKDAV